jgi:hypothetical protein
MKALLFNLVSEARIWHNGCVESFSSAGVILLVLSGRVVWLTDGTKEGFCNCQKESK